MRAHLLLLSALLAGCIEYTPTSTYPPAGVPNARPLDVVENQDALVQVQVPEVDVLWVIDNSSSMLDEQNALTANFPAFMDYFLGSGLDYHIGVISTDFATDQGRLETTGGVRWVDPATPDPITTFATLAGLGIQFGTNEMGRDPAYAALELLDAPGGFNDGFQRREGSLHVVVISDEDDHSTQITVNEFANYLETSRPDPDNVTFNGIVTPPGGCLPNGNEPGLGYVDLHGKVGGILASICSEDWVGVLEQLGIQAAGLQREYFLSQLPVLGTIAVSVVDEGTTYEFEEDVDWTYQPTRNSIVFIEYIPSALAQVNITYEVLSAGEQ